jgi:glucose/mannose-6-phosphate isomerase
LPQLEADRSDMLGRLADYPDQLRAAYPAGRRAGEAAVRRAEGPGCVLVLGTGGGSAAAAYVASSVTRPYLRVPLMVCQGYDPPGYAIAGPEVGAGASSTLPVGRSLIIAASHSGETEETLEALRRVVGSPGGAVAAFADGLGRPEGAGLGPNVVVISGGGRLSAQAGRAGWPLVSLPVGMQARAVFPGILAAMLGVFEGAGLTYSGPATALEANETAFSGFEAEIEEAAGLACRLATTWGPSGWGRIPADAADRDRPSPFHLAQRVAGHLPIIYGGAGVTPGVARRWKNQMAENGKTLAHWYTVPEAHHDEVVGWEAPAALRERLFALILRDPSAESPRMRKRLDVTARLLGEKVLSPDRVVEVGAEGRGRLARAVGLSLFGDYFSCYLALLRGIDPTPVPIIVSLKEEMARG